MKRLFIVAAIILVFIQVNVYAFDSLEYSLSSDEKTADALILTGEGYLYGLLVATDGTNAVTVSVYDNTTNSGVELVPTWIAVTNSVIRVQYLPLPFPVRCSNGIYVDITCAGTAAYNAYYRAKR